MNYRKDPFINKFTSAQLYLKNKAIQNIVSIKYREHCVNHDEYLHLIEDYIKGKLNLNVKSIDGDFQGHAWLVSDNSNNEVILVEHETGLEILCIAGSIASIIGIFPFIISGLRFIKDRFSPHRYHDLERERIEIRKLDSKNILIENHVQNIETYILQENSKENEKLKRKVSKLEKEVNDLKKTLKKNK